MTGPRRVVLLHGVGLDRTMWGPVAALLPDDVEVTAPDLPGHGGRPAVAAGATLADLAADVAGRIPPDAHVVGFSLGALVAQHLARFRPDLVASLTSVSSVCRRTPDERAAVLQRLRTAEEDFPASVEASLHRWFPDGEAAPDLVRRTRSVLEANDVPSYLSCYRVFATGDAEIGPELGRIDVPALAVTGDLDPGSTPEMTRRLARAVPGCRAVVVPGARHLWPLQRPADLVAHLTPLLEGATRV